MKSHLGFVINMLLALSLVANGWVELDARSAATVLPFGAPTADNFLTWVQVNDGKLPQNAVPGGTDDDGQIEYVCKGNDGVGIAPGKFKLNKGSNTTGKAYIPWGTTEHVISSDFQILTVSNLSLLEWVRASNGAVPPMAVVGGPDENKEIHYIGRFNYFGTTIVGKIHPSHRVCYVAHNGQELRNSTYEALTLVNKCH